MESAKGPLESPLFLSSLSRTIPGCVPLSMDNLFSISKYNQFCVNIFVYSKQEKTLKIGELEIVLTEALSRNYIKYMITKMLEDNVIDTESAGRGTRYKIKAPFDVLRGIL